MEMATASERARRPTPWACAFAAATLLLRLPFAALPFDPRDEGYYAAVARATVGGSRLYADQWYVRPPLLNLVYAWSYRFSLATTLRYDLSVRIFAALFAAATVGVFSRLLFTEFSLRAALLGSVVAALTAASLTLQNEANAETWMMLPYTLSALIVLHVALTSPTTRRALWSVALAGILTGIAAAFKQVALVNLALPVIAWLVFDREHVGRWIARTMAFAGGLLGTWAVVVLGVGLRDDIRAFLYYAWLRNMVYMRNTHANSDWLRTLATVIAGPLVAFTVAACAVLALFAMSLTRTGAPSRGTRVGLFALAWLCVSAVGVAASGRFYEHYFIQATVPLALLLAASADALLNRDRRRPLAATAFALAAVLAIAAPSASWAADLHAAGSIAAQRRVFEDLGESELPRLTRPGGTFLVWGICAGVKAYCPLASASHLPVVCYDYGWSPVERGSLLGEEFPSTADVVLAELRHRAPDTVVLTAPLNAPSGANPAEAPNDGVRLVWALRSLLTGEYTVVDRGVGYVVLKRRS